MQGLEQFLIEYDKKGIYPMHMPGHKRNTKMMSMVNPYSIDVTEAGELDDMHKPEGILKECIEDCGRAFGSASSFYLINGSTGGILAAISAMTKRGEKILISRACHKSVYNAIYLNELSPIYIYLEFDENFGIYGSVSPTEVEERLKENPDIKLVVITSPTYEGVVSDVAAIAEACHKYGAVLLVDAAHGAHFGFSKGFPEKAVSLGADISVESIHKTLPAFTQTSLLHFNSKIVSIERLKRFLTIYQTTSPSYILMSGIDKCVKFLDSEAGKKAFGEYEKRLESFSLKMKELKNLKVLCKGRDSKENHSKIHDFDAGKIVISTKNTEITGAALEKMLREEFLIQLEMSMGDYAIAMTSICDTDEGFERLAAALLKIDRKLKKTGKFKSISGKIPENEVVLKPFEGMEGERRLTDRKECRGKISCEYLYAYPPGIPLIASGEKISQEMLEYIEKLENMGTEIYSTSGNWPKKIFVIAK